MLAKATGNELSKYALAPDTMMKPGIIEAAITASLKGVENFGLSFWVVLGQPLAEEIGQFMR